MRLLRRVGSLTGERGSDGVFGVARAGSWTGVGGAFVIGAGAIMGSAGVVSIGSGAAGGSISLTVEEGDGDCNKVCVGEGGVGVVAVGGENSLMGGAAGSGRGTADAGEGGPKGCALSCGSSRMYCSGVRPKV